MMYQRPRALEGDAHGEEDPPVSERDELGREVQKQTEPKNSLFKVVLNVHPDSAL